MRFGTGVMAGGIIIFAMGFLFLQETPYGWTSDNFFYGIMITLQGYIINYGPANSNYPGGINGEQK